MQTLDTTTRRQKLQAVPSQPSDPPALPDVEKVVIGGILLDPHALGRVIRDLEPEAFTVPAYQDIYRAAIEVNGQGKAVDLMSVAQYLYRVGLLEKIGGQATLAKLVNDTVSAVNIDQHAEVLIDLQGRRKLSEAGEKIRLMGLDRKTPLSELQGQAAQSVLNLGAGGNKGGVSLAEYASDYVAAITALLDGGSAVTIPTGLHDYDSMTTGLERGTLTLWAARPSMGKSALITAIASFVASLGYKVLFYSLEMKKAQVMSRLCSMVCEIPYQDLNIGNFQLPSLQAKWIDALAEVAKLPITINTNRHLTIEDIVADATLESQHGPELGLVIVDHIGCLTRTAPPAYQQHELGKISHLLKTLAGDLNVNVSALAQLNREVEHRTNKRPQQSDLRDSGKLEEDADTIISVYRDEYYNPDTPDRNITELGILKQRNGPTGTVKLLHNLGVNQYKSLYTGSTPPTYRSLPTPAPRNQPVSTPAASEFVRLAEEGANAAAAAMMAEGGYLHDDDDDF